MADLIALLNTLVDSKGRILIPGINDSVAKLTDKEKKLYEPIDFDPVSALKATFKWIVCFGKAIFSIL